MAEGALAKLLSSLYYPDFVEPELKPEDEIDYGPAKGHVELGGELEPEQFDQLARDPHAVRCGATIHPNERKNWYSHEGYNGTMYYMKVRNMKAAENELLQSKDWPMNIQKRSNKSDTDEPGCVYVIVEE